MARFNGRKLVLVEKEVEQLPAQSRGSAVSPTQTDENALLSISLGRKVALAAMVFCCQSSAYYGLTIWIARFLSPWGVSASAALILIGLAELPGLAATAAILRRPKCEDGGRIRLVLAFYFAASSALAAAIAYVESRAGAMLSFCLLYCFIVGIWTLMYGGERRMSYLILTA
jgi:hypothetical protein